MTSLENALDLVRKELVKTMGINPVVRYSRLQTLGEIPAVPRYFVEPGGVETQRRNFGAPRQIFQIRCVSERLVPPAEVPDAARAEAEFWLLAAWKFMSEPRLGYEAFVRSAVTFSDAPSGYNVEALDSGAGAVVGGVELTVVFD